MFCIYMTWRRKSRSFKHEERNRQICASTIHKKHREVFLLQSLASCQRATILYPAKETPYMQRQIVEVSIEVESESHEKRAQFTQSKKNSPEKRG
jgi:hypothetical protein